MALSDKDRIFTNVYGYQPWNLKAAKANLADATQAAHQLLTVKDLPELSSTVQSVATPNVSKAASYGRNVYNINAEAAAEFAKLVEARIAERGITSLQLYNGAIHHALLAQPNFVRDLLAQPAQPIRRGETLEEVRDPSEHPEVIIKAG